MGTDELAWPLCRDPGEVFEGDGGPDTIQAGNTVSSAKVADARIEYRTSAKLDTAEVMGWLARFFMSFIPL